MQVTKGVRSVAHNSREALSALPVSRVASRVPLRKLHYAYGEGRAFDSTAQRAEEKTAQVKPGFVESDCPSGFWDIGTGQLSLDNAQPSSDVSADWHTWRARLIPEQPSPGDYIHTLPHLPLQGSSIKDLKQRVLHDSSDDDEFQALQSQGRPEGPHVPAVLTASNMVPAQPLRQWVTSSSSSPTNSKPTSAATTAGFTKPVKAGSTCSSGSSGSFDGASPMHNMLTREGLKDINKKSEEEEVVMSAVTVMAEHDHYLDAVLPGGIYPAHMDIGGYDGGFDGGYNAGSYDSSVADLGHAWDAPASSETRTSARNSVSSGSARSGNSGRAMPAAVASSGNDLGVEPGSAWDMDWLSPVQQPGVLMVEGVEGAGDGPDLV